MSRPAGSGAKPSVVSMIIAARSPSRRGDSGVPPEASGTQHPVNFRAVLCHRFAGGGVLRMDMSLVAAIMSMKAGALQQQVATSTLKSNLDTQKSSVLTLLGAAQQT